MVLFYPRPTGAERTVMARMWGGVFRSMGRLSTAGLLMVAGPLAAQTQDIQNLAEQVIRRLDLQTDFPTIELPPRPLFSLPAEVLWIVIAVAIAVLLYAFRDLIPGLGARRGGSWDPDDGAFGTTKANAPAVALG